MWKIWKFWTKLKMFYTNKTQYCNFEQLQGLRLQICLAFSVSLINMSDGMSVGWSSAIIGQMAKYSSNSTSLQESSLIGTLPVYSSVILVFVFSSSRFSQVNRKMTILIGSFCLFISWMLVVFSTNINVIYVAVVLRGLIHYIIYKVSAVYLAEIAQADVRGILVNFIPILLNCGMLFSYMCIVSMSLQALAILAAAIAALMLILFRLAPNSPYFLLMSHKPDEAREALHKLRGTTPARRDELQEIKELIDKSNNENESFMELFRDKANRRILTIVLMVQVIQQLACIEPILLFLEVILETSDNKMSLVCFGAMKLLSCTLALILIDKIGRRPLLIISSLLASIALTILGWHFYKKEFSYQDDSTPSYIPLILLLFYILSYNVGLGSINFVLGSEMFPTRFKALGNAFVQLTSCVSMLVVTQVFAVAKDAFGFYLAFWIFGVLTFFGFLFCYVLVIETKGKTLHEIQMELNAKVDWITI